MVRIFYRSVRTPPPDATFLQKLQSVFWNTGNLFFEEALARQIIGFETVFDIIDVPKDVDLLLLSMSNFISPAADLTEFVREVKARNIRQLVMVGAGAQAQDYGDEIRLHDSVIEFLRILSDRSVSIGVRGHFTAEWLRDFGLRNVDVVGCPSAFWHSGGFSLDRKSMSRDAPLLAVHSTPHGHFRDRVSALMSHGVRYNAEYVVQSEGWIMQLAQDVGVGQERAQANAEYFALPFLSKDVLVEWLQAKWTMYFDMVSWLSAMSQKQFVYGSRFHGNMAAIQAGTPALNMPFDTRTRELCEFLNLPHIPFRDFDERVPPWELAESTDFHIFNQTYPTKLSNYISFLDRNRVPHRMTAPEAPQVKSNIADRVRLKAASTAADDMNTSGTASDLEIQKRMGRERSYLDRLQAESGKLR